MGEMGAPQATQNLDFGLAGLSLIAGYYHIAADPAQLSHQLALTGRMAGAGRARSRREIPSAEIAYPQPRHGQATRCDAVPGDYRPQGGRFRRARCRFGAGTSAPDRSDLPRRAGARDRGNCRPVHGRTGADHAPARRGRRRPRHLRFLLVLAVDLALPARRSRMCWSRPCSCNCSHWRRRSFSSWWSTRCSSTRACRRWWCWSSGW